MQKLVLKSSKSLTGSQANLKQGQQKECHAYTEGKFLLLKVSFTALQIGDIVFSHPCHYWTIKKEVVFVDTVQGKVGLLDEGDTL